MSYTAPADLPAQWRASADTLERCNDPELRPGIVALRECADANASAYLDRLGIPALGGHVDTSPEPPTPPEPAACTCGHPRDWHSYDKYACYTGSPMYNKPCQCRTYTPNE